jgi:hypothetical protein
MPNTDSLLQRERGFAVTELLNGLPFIQMDLVGQDLFERFVNQLFATDRKAIPKGMIEVIL